MLSTAVITRSTTSPCMCCWENLSILKYGSSTPQIPVWCCWCISVLPTPALGKLCGCCFITGMPKKERAQKISTLLYGRIFVAAVFAHKFNLFHFKWLMNVKFSSCPNPLDPAPPETVFSDPKPPSPQSQMRRFNIRTFQFLPDGDFQDINEEVRLW